MPPECVFPEYVLPECVFVVAVAANNIIGRDGAIPWRLPADLRRFRQLTMGHPVLMGRRTFLSLGRPLPGRHNIVLTRNRGWQHDGVSVVHDLPAAWKAAERPSPDSEPPLMVIGGADIYAAMLPCATRLEMTEVALSPDGDTRFPAIDRAEWEEVARETHAAQEGQPGYAFVTLQRKLAPPAISR